MSDAEQRFLADVQLAARQFRDYHPEAVLCLHHNDTDGLTSGAILQALFERLGLRTARYCLEKPYPVVLERILNQPFSGQRGMVVITDFASGMLPTIAKLNRARVPVLVLDHHDIQPTTDALIRVVNPRAHGVAGDTDCSASAVCALFALACDARHEDLAKLGVQGAIGDGMVSAAGEFQGPNADLACLASARGDLLQHRGLWLRFSGDTVVATDDLRKYLDALGSVQYFSGGPDIAIKGLLEGFDSRYVHLATEAREQLEKALREFLSVGQIERSAELQVFHLGSAVANFGVKTVGLFCEAIADQGTPTAPLYTLGYQPVLNSIPGIGPIEINQVKLSMRVSSKCRGEIVAGRAPSLRKLISEVASSMSCFVDACHDFAGAATVAPGQEQEFTERVRARIKLPRV